MSKLSEEEIINTLEGMLYNEDIFKHNDYIETPFSLEQQNAIKGLLALYNKEKEKNSRNKKIILDKLDKLKYGIENDFPITLGERQPLWEENKTNYISKDKIEAKIKELEKEIAKSKNNAQSGERYFAIELYKELMEE